MPTPLMKKYAKQANTSIDHVEEIWEKAKESADKKFVKGSRYWAYVNSIVRKALKLNENSELIVELYELSEIQS